MTISCIIVDDEPLAVKLLESFVQRTPFLNLRASYTDSVAAISSIREQPCDLVFLDIQMPDLNGMELAEMIPHETRVIFTTAFKQYAFDSYGVNALDFLLKPIRYQKFLAAVEKAREWFEMKRKADPTPSPALSGRGVQADVQAESLTAFPRPVGTGLGVGSESLFLKVDRELRQVQLDDILYVQGMKDYVVFVLQPQGNRSGKPQTLITHMTMGAVEAMLPNGRFMRVNRSYIISLDKIRSVDKNDCVYIGEEIIRVTDAYADSFHAYIDKRVAGK